MRWVFGALIAIGTIIVPIALFVSCTSSADKRADALAALLFEGIVPIAIGATGILVPMYNRLVVGRNRCQMAMSNVDVLLKRRFDLVGNLVAVVGQYAAHENTTFKEVAEYRSRATAPTTMAAKVEEIGRRLTPTFVAIAEAYPELKADKSYRQLFDQLRETEDGIASTRIEYNRAVMEQNTRINVFPDVLIARKFGFAEQAFFSASDGERQVVSTVWQPGESSQVIASQVPGRFSTMKPAPAAFSESPPSFPPGAQKPVSGSAAAGTRHPDEPPPFPPNTARTAPRPPMSG